MFENKKNILGTGIVIFFVVAVFSWYFFASKKGENITNPLVKPGASLPRKTKNFYPSQIVDLSAWKLNLPISSSDNSSSPLDVLQPKLATFEMKPWFRATPDRKGVVFRAPVNAPTTANSSYPRSELREMTDNGKKEASWSTTSGTHTLFLDEAITAVPQNKPDVVAGQIHGDDDDLIVIRLEGQKLFLARSRQNLATLDDNYVLGQRFSIKFLAADGKIAVYYNNGVEPAYTLSKEVKEAYFKAGVYTQSNCETEDSPDLCNADNFGEVIIYRVDVSHSG